MPNTSEYIIKSSNETIYKQNIIVYVNKVPKHAFIKISSYKVEKKTKKKKFKLSNFNLRLYLSKKRIQIVLAVIANTEADRHFCIICNLENIKLSPCAMLFSDPDSKFHKTIQNFKIFVIILYFAIRI